MVKENCFVASIDLSDTYYSVPVVISDQKGLMFQVER